jgi:hypothetical protein
VVTSITPATGQVTAGGNPIVGWALQIRPVTPGGNAPWKVLGTGTNTGNPITLCNQAFKSEPPGFVK